MNSYKCTKMFGNPVKKTEVKTQSVKNDAPTTKKNTQR